MSTRYKCLIPLIGLLIAGCGDDSGKKQSECPGGGTMCPDGQCYNLSFDNDHCGRCDNVCSETESCQAGVCDPIPIEARCIAPKLVCGDVCVDPRGDREHCGNCTTRCEDDELCKNSSCVKSCEAPETACSDGCHDLNSDTKNCKTCGHDCNAGLAEGETPYVCVNGDCVNDCPNGELICGGNCTNPKTSKNYCGASDDCKGANAGKVCAAGAECNDGICSCTNSGESVCKIGGELKCANAKSSETCGCDENGAGVNCSALPNIESGECGSDGQCNLVCSQNFDNCNGDAADGCETDLTTIENCGSCGNACDAANTTGAVCENGSCKYTCGEGAVLCDGSCADLSKDNDNCGWCGNKCTGKSSCQGGFCVIDSSECKDGYVEGISVVGYDGTEKTVKAYCIQDYDELVNYRDYLNSSNSMTDDGVIIPYPSAEDNPDNAYILMGNINMGSNTTWTPIGIGPTFKDAIFLGNGKKIYGTLINSGLFAITENAVIQDLNLELNINYKPQSNYYNYPGALIEIISNNVALRRIKEKGTIECYASQCGGIVGIVSGDCSSTLSQIDMEGTIYAIDGRSNVGGVMGVAEIKQIDHVTANVSIVSTKDDQYQQGLLAGRVYDSEKCAGKTALITDCHVKGSIKFSEEGEFAAEDTTHSAVIGGMIGQVDLNHLNLNIEKSSADAQIDMQPHYGGGLIAKIDTYDDVQLTISDCKASGSLDCWSNCGGLVGFMSYSNQAQNPGTKNVTNSHAKVDIKSESEYEQMDNFGGFVGDVTHSIIKDCTAAGKIETVASVNVGGFVGLAEKTTLSNVSFEGSVAGQNYVGGIGGYMTSNCIVENAIAKGTVKSGHTAGGLIGYAFDADRIENGVTFADVEGQMQCGSFIGQYRGGTLSNCVATGKTVCLGEGGVGGFFGNVSGLTTLKQIVSLSDITSETYSGGLAGSASDGPLTFENIFINGNVASNNGASGAIFGMAYIVSIDTLNNVYYWKSAEDMNLIGVGTGGIDLTGVKSFTYNSEKKPVLEDGTSLIEELKDTGKWLEGACKLTTGPGLANPGVYYIPVLKSLGMDICGND